MSYECMDKTVASFQLKQWLKHLKMLFLNACIVHSRHRNVLLYDQAFL